MTILCIRVSIFLQPTLSLSNGLTKLPRWEGWRLCMGSAAWPSTHQDKFGYCHCWVPNLLQETYTESPIWHCSLEWSASYLWQVDYTGLLSPLMAQMVNNLAAVGETQVWSLGQEDPLEKGMATHSSILAWRILRTEEPEPRGLQSMWPQRATVHVATKSQTRLSN